MKLDVPHGLRRLPPAPELRRTQDTANPSHKEHIYLYVLRSISLDKRPGPLTNIRIPDSFLYPHFSSIFFPDVVSHSSRSTA
jgi:hypothetical protein